MGCSQVPLLLFEVVIRMHHFYLINPLSQLLTHMRTKSIIEVTKLESEKNLKGRMFCDHLDMAQLFGSLVDSLWT